MTGSVSNAVPRITFSADQLPAELDDGARYRLWRDIYTATYVELDYARLADQRFAADFQFLQFGSVGFGQFASTIASMQRTKANIAAKPRDHLCVVMLGSKPMHATQAGRDQLHAAGSTLLTYEGESATLSCPEGSEWLLLDVPRALLKQRHANIEDLVAAPIADTAASRHLRNYVSHLLATDVENDDQLTGSIGEHLLDLIGLTLGARGDVAEHAGMRGLRAARLREIIREIEMHFAGPISAQTVALRLGLSARYVHHLLQETGTAFSERVLELRLQKARAVLADPRHDRLKIGEIAEACGFNDVSYFNRCFRRRFGASPTQFRGASDAQSD
jgi:AraC-like DNA-binding protein